MSRELAPRYDPKAVETGLYREWTEAGAFRADSNSPKPPFSIVIPPPNVTGALHMGHALNNTLQDMLTRWKRMEGFNACWIPGTDHASIATTVMIERELKKEGKSRHDLGREKFLERAWAWKEKYGSRIVEQLKQMGCSCDWERLRFTMDEGLSRAVVEHFVRLHEEGLIYRGERIVNWCPRCLTALSDLEVKHADRKSHLWYIKYPLKGGGEVVVATTRPETMLGDTAVAVNPEDKRHKSVVGRTAILPLMEREIPVIADAMVAMDFGTGAVKITPAHDPADFDLGKRHGLGIINILEKDACLSPAAGTYAGLDRMKAREKVVADLAARGLLLKIEDHTSAVTHCQRCDTVLEPMVSMQWWMKMEELAKPAIRAVELGQREPGSEGAIRLVPESSAAVFHEWMKNIRDWCISRQLWWGHRIPAWHCTACSSVAVARTAPANCPECGGGVEQDPDTLDTWFSSALWPISTLGWPDETEMKRLGFEVFYPTTILVTAADIIFLWVARMAMAGLKFTGKVPFRTVVFNSLITDPEGKKMSKTKGNVVDPLELFDRFGTDAVRFTLAEQETLKQSFRMSEDKVEHGRNFMNKIWNASRFILPNLGEFDPSPAPPAGRTLADRWILSRLQGAAEAAAAALESNSFSEYAGGLEDFFWHDFCDTYVELAKPALKNPAHREPARWTLWRVLHDSLHLLHPVIPFITEEIWRKLPHPGGAGKFLMLEPFPKPDRSFRDAEAEELMAVADLFVRNIRVLRHEQGLPPKAVPEIHVRAADAESRRKLGRIGETLEYIESLCRAKIVPVAAKKAKPEDSRSRVAAVFSGFTAELRLETAADKSSETKRLSKELAELEALLKRTEQLLSNGEYLAKAPSKLVAQTRLKAEDYRLRVAKLKERLKETKPS